MAFPVAEEFIANAEKELKLRFPDALRRRLAKNNGGEIVVAEESWQLHPVLDTSDRKRVGRTANHIVRETNAAQSWPGFPELGIAIAANGSGDRLILIRLAGDRSSCEDAVFLWGHETKQIEKLEETFEDLFDH